VGGIVCSAIIAFGLLVFVVDRFVLSPVPATAPMRAK
jgi:hypothetical protein